MFLPLNLPLFLVMNLPLFLITDDQAGHHTLHHSLGNHLSEQEVQVISKILATFCPVFNFELLFVPCCWKKKNDFSYSTSLNLSVRPSRPPSWSCSWESASHRSRISSSISSAPSSPCSPSLRHASGRLYPCDCCSAAQASCWIL